jgi:glutathione synthase
MSLKIALQMDAIEKINFSSDSTLLLGLEAQRRGYELFYYQPHQLYLLNGKAFANAYTIELYSDENNYYKLSEEKKINLEMMDVILMRQDPPFDMNYITACHILEKIAHKTIVINNPAEVRNCPEKLFICDFPDLMPPTIISKNYRAIKNFKDHYKDIVIKPLYAHGGRDVLRINDDNNFDQILENFSKIYDHPFIAQKFLPEIIEGDKRIILSRGHPIGAMKRVPQDGEIKSNLVAGGTAHPCKLTKRDIDICNIIGPELDKRGLLLAGIDIIGDYITEINVTSPTGLAAINKIDNICLESIIWDDIIKSKY